MCGPGKLLVVGGHGGIRQSIAYDEVRLLVLKIVVDS